MTVARAHALYVGGVLATNQGDYVEGARMLAECLDIRRGLGNARETAVTWTRALERSLCYAYGCWEVLDQRRPKSIDLIVGRSTGLGSSPSSFRKLMIGMMLPRRLLTPST